MLGPLCPSCSCLFVTRQRVIVRLMRGALACMFPWRLGALLAFPAEEVAVADEADALALRLSRPVGGPLGVGNPCLRAQPLVLK